MSQSQRKSDKYWQELGDNIQAVAVHVQGDTGGIYMHDGKKSNENSKSKTVPHKSAFRS